MKFQLNEENLEGKVICIHCYIRDLSVMRPVFVNRQASYLVRIPLLNILMWDSAGISFQSI